MKELFVRIRLAAMILVYPFHLFFRRFHDNLFLRYRFYRRLSALAEKRRIHLIVIMAYLLSLVAFALLRF